MPRDRLVVRRAAPWMPPRPAGRRSRTPSSRGSGTRSRSCATGCTITTPTARGRTSSSLPTTGSINEVDLLVLTPKGFYLVEIKSRPGIVEGDQGTWTWRGGGRVQTVDNPLLLANRKAKKLISLLRRQPALQRKTSSPFLEAHVFLSHEDVDCRVARGPARPGASPRHRRRARRAARDRRGAHPAQHRHAGPHAARPADGQGGQPRHAGSRHSPVAARPARGRLPARRAAARRPQLPGLDGAPRGDRRRTGTGQDLCHRPVGLGRRAVGAAARGPARVPDPAGRSARGHSRGQGVHRARSRPGARLRAPRRLPALRPLAHRTGRQARRRYAPPPAPAARRCPPLRPCEALGPPCAVAAEHPGGRPGGGAAASPDLQLADRRAGGARHRHDWSGHLRSESSGPVRGRDGLGLHGARGGDRARPGGGPARRLLARRHRVPPLFGSPAGVEPLRADRTVAG